MTCGNTVKHTHICPRRIRDDMNKPLLRANVGHPNTVEKCIGSSVALLAQRKSRFPQNDRESGSDIRVVG